jgi:hypothetical protein
MDPITLSILAGMGGSAITSLPKLIPSKLDRENKRRLEALKKREERGLLGLSQKEEAAMYSGLRSTADQASEQMEQQQKALLAGGGQATGGQALAASLGLQQERMAMESEIGDRILQADLAERQREMDELRALEAAVAQKKQERVEAAVGIAGAGLEAGLTGAAQQATIQGQKDISPAQVSGLASQLGISEQEARGMYELAIENPEMMKYLTASRGQ